MPEMGVDKDSASATPSAGPSVNNFKQIGELLFALRRSCVDRFSDIQLSLGVVHRPTSTGAILKQLFGPSQRDLGGIHFRATTFQVAPRHGLCGHQICPRSDQLHLFGRCRHIAFGRQQRHQHQDRLRLFHMCAGERDGPVLGPGHHAGYGCRHDDRLAQRRDGFATQCPPRRNVLTLDDAGLDSQSPRGILCQRNGRQLGFHWQPFDLRGRRVAGSFLDAA